MEPIKSGDLPPGTEEGIRKLLGDKYPGKEIRFAGDVGEESLTPELLDMMNRLEQEMKNSLNNGTCYDCGEKCPLEPWPPKDGDELPEGWIVLLNIADDRPMGIICPECDESDDNEEDMDDVE